MPTKLPRIQVVLDKKTHREVKRKARKDGLSMSSEIGEMIKECLSAQEERPFKPFTGENMDKFIGKFSLGQIDNLDALLLEQVHGIPD
jgi:hypothetical protein